MTDTPATYSTRQAATAAGVSDAAIRGYCSGRFASCYAGLFSPGATPAPGQPRAFDAQDVKTLRYIRERTAAGAQHAEIAADLPEALDSFDWQPPPPEEPRQAGRRRSPSPPVGDAPAEEPPAQLAVLSQFVNVLGQQLTDANRRAADYADQLADARERAAAAEARAAELAAQLERSRRPWWARLFGP